MRWATTGLQFGGGILADQLDQPIPLERVRPSALRERRARRELVA